MTESEKIFAAGCAAGATAAAIPAAYAISQNMKRKPLGEHDFIRAENGGFISECGERVTFRGINLNDDILNFQKWDLSSDANTQDVFSSLEGRFGRYGAKELLKKYNENFISDADLKFIGKLGANCVRVPLRHKTLCRKDNCKGDFDFERLDKIVEKCRRLGIYVIFDLHSAPGFQNHGSACAQNEESVFFNSGKEGFEARNAAIRLWTGVAAHYCDEPAVAGYDLLNRPLHFIPDQAEKLDVLYKFYRRALKAIRAVDARHTVIMQIPEAEEGLPEIKEENIAFGFYSHMNTSFEADTLKNKTKSSEEIPCIVCKVRAVENTEYILSALNEGDISWVYGDFKGNGAGCVFSGSISPANLDADKYDEIGEKWSKPVSTKNYTENKELSRLLKSKIKENSLPKPEKKPKIGVKFGKTVIIGRKASR